MKVKTSTARLAGIVLGVVLLSVAIAAVVGMAGLSGFGDVADDGTRVDATVTAATPCAGGATETVTFTLDGRERTAKLDACGHHEGDPVAVTVPAGAGEGELMVRDAGASTGSSGPPSGVGLGLLTLSGFAGAAYALLVRRGPATAPLIPLLG